MRAEVTMPFRDRETWRAYAVGEAYEGGDARVAELEAGGYVVGGVTGPSAPTVQQLRALCAERGVDAPKRATKAQLLALLGE